MALFRRSPRDPSAEADAARLSVVVVDDDAQVHRTIRRALPNATVTETFTVAEFLGVLDGSAPDVLIVDRALPDGSGFDAIRVIRSDRRLAEVPVIATTGGSVDRDQLEAVDAGADDYIPKVSDLHKLPLLIDRLLQLSAPERATRRAAVRDRYFPRSI